MLGAERKQEAAKFVYQRFLGQYPGKPRDSSTSKVCHHLSARNSLNIYFVPDSAHY